MPYTFTCQGDGAHRKGNTMTQNLTTRFCSVGDRVKRYQYDSVEWSSRGTVVGFDDWNALVLWDGDNHPTPVRSYNLQRVA